MRLSFTPIIQKLFSSMPQREYAIQNITLSFGHHSSVVNEKSITDHNGDDDDGVILLVGRSGSGKSTLLRLLSGMECPNNYHGGGYNNILVNDHAIISNESIDATKKLTFGEKSRMDTSRIPSWVKMGMLPEREISVGFVQPVVLVGKPEFDDTLSVMERIVQMGEDAVSRFEKYARWRNQPKSNESMRSFPPTNENAAISTTMIQRLAQDIASLLTLTKNQVSCRPSKLSPSGEYLFGIACGCMMSMAPSIALAASNTSIKWNDENEDHDVGVYYPILLLDELFDAEHPSIVESCARGMLNLIHAGGVVISATHRPSHFRGMSTRTITLSSGKVLGRIDD